MANVAVVTDSNSGITFSEAEELGVRVVPMPFYIDGDLFYEEIDLSQEAFYEKLETGADIKTSMPIVGELTDLWDEILKDYDQLVYIPMSSGLSGSTQAADMISRDDEYIGKVFVVDNQRISVTQRQSVIDAKALADAGKTGLEIKKILEKVKMESSIYIMLDTLYYLKKGGRITPAAAAIGTVLQIKPVLQINGEKLDAFAKARNVKAARKIMIDQIKKDFEQKYNGSDGSDIHLAIAYTKDIDAAMSFKEQVNEAFPGMDILVRPLSLSVSCHIGPGALAIACSKAITID